MNLTTAIITTNLLELQRKQISKFVNTIFECMNNDTEAVFNAQLTFQNGKLDLTQLRSVRLFILSFPRYIWYLASKRKLFIRYCWRFKICR